MTSGFFFTNSKAADKHLKAIIDLEKVVLTIIQEKEANLYI